MEAWRQYGGFYKMVDFTTSWTYDTPPVENVIGTPQVLDQDLPFSTAHQGDQVVGSWSQSVIRHSSLSGSPAESSSRRSTGDLGDLGLGLVIHDSEEMEVGPEIGNYDIQHDDYYSPEYHYGAGGMVSTITGSTRSTGTSQSTMADRLPQRMVVEVQQEGKRPFKLVKRWFSSVKANLGKRKRIGRRNYDDQVENVVMPSMPPMPPMVSTPKPLRPQHSRSVSFVEQQADERRCEECDQAQERGVVDWSRPLALREWKEWGYYARPCIDGVYVTNYPPNFDIDIDNISYAEIEKIAASLIDEHGNERAEVWKPGVQHPSLPPRPPRWGADPAPYWPGQCQLNPYLRRKLVGEPPLFWDMGKEPATAVHGHSLIATPLLPPDRAQPATWPMTTHFFISALADDVEFKWPILIRNKYGVTVQDVLDWIYTNFQEAVDCDEWATWPQYLRTIANISYDKRQERDHLKRIDYLGFHSMFRGFEASPDGQSWYLYVGRPY